MPSQSETEALLRRRLDETQRLAHLGSWELDLRENDIRTGPVWWSDEVYRLLGYEPGGVPACSENFLARVHPEDREALTEAAKGAVETGSFEMIVRVESARDGERFLLSQASLVRDENGQPARLVGTVQDITDRVACERELTGVQTQLQKEVLERTGQLAASHRELDAFSYSISHDLRAPLRSIDGFARILQEDFASALPPAAQDYLERITRSAAQMGRLIDGLLDFSRVGRQTFTAARVDMDTIVDAVIAQFDEETRGREVIWERTALPPADGDAALLRQVWLQLVGNALKFTRGRTPTRIQIGAEETSGGLAYYIRDNGVGFDPRYAERLFTVFQRLHRPEQFEGSGVGLAIAHRVIERHEGRIEAHGAPEVGAVVRFRLWTR